MNSKYFQHFWDMFGGVSIRTKIFGMVLGSTLLLSIVFTIQVRTAQLKMLELESQKQGLSVARDVAARATDLILVNDLYSLHQLLAETKANYSDVRYVFIINNAGEILAHTFGEGFPLDLISINNVQHDVFQNTVVLKTDEGTMWDVAVPIFEGKAGRVRVGLSDQNVRATMTSLTSQLLITIISVLLINLLAATLLTWVLTRPIIGLVEATHAVAQGDFSSRVERWANDEIGDLSVAFNKMAIELGRMDDIRKEREQLRKQLLESIIIAQEQERKRISRELHDSTSQSLTSLKIGLRNLDEICKTAEVHERIQQLRNETGKTLEDVHALAVQLRPTILDDLGLQVALERLIDAWGNRHEISADVLIRLGEQRLSESAEITLYRIVQEALSNIAKHAQANSISVLVEYKHNNVTAIIEDNGKGFSVDDSVSEMQLGLLGMQERAELLSGKFTIESKLNQGTSIFVTIPLENIQESF
jgi:signal transduction histidine kinase